MFSICHHYIDHNCYDHSVYMDFSDIVKWMVWQSLIDVLTQASHMIIVFSRWHLHQSNLWESMLKAGYAINTQTSTVPAQSNEWENRTWHLSIGISKPEAMGLISTEGYYSPSIPPQAAVLLKTFQQFRATSIGKDIIGRVKVSNGWRGWLQIGRVQSLFTS